MTEYANIVYNEATLKDPVDNTKLNPPDPGGDDTQGTVWTNKQLMIKAITELNAKYALSVTAPSVGGEHFVTKFDYGMKSAEMKLSHVRGM